MPVLTPNIAEVRLISSHRAEVCAPARASEAPSPVQAAKRCPGCGASAAAALPICYGTPAPSVLAQARRGEVVIGPMNHGRNEPRLCCQQCGERYGAPRPELDRFGRPCGWIRKVAAQRSVAAPTAPSAPLGVAAVGARRWGDAA